MGTSVTPHADGVLPAEDRRLHRALLEALLAEGRISPPAALAEAAGVDIAALPAHLQALADGDYLCLDAAGAITCLYPLSPAPTPHVVVIDGRRRHAMCALDALGIPAMLDQSIEVEGRCAVCGVPVRLHVGPDAVERAEPATTLVAAYRGGDQAAAEVCCPNTRFACGPDHGALLVERMPGTTLLSLDLARTGAAEVFGVFLRAVELPAKRRRVRVAVPR